ncbi:hypothetical protein C1I98_33015 [Spongiactinospora gelatinilytica]|uniref:Copper chaperone PCu(A)C n=1 Tax=Spongiactinospora gelatinilytica TaxID=2666298 RepID=A0A2W2FUC1_9ACTN|nr:copper chaperone PCu(A)C [Spongiactinospora gelatinilytica]PZG28128.1 hypothetical protein C1I98_33015 [Spongiactinospora gelatinilytica]
MFSRVTIATVGLAVAALTTACGTTQAAPAAAPVSLPASASSSSEAPGAALSITDPWVKTAGKGMTAAFGTLVNNSGADITVVAGSTPLSPKVELHEVVESKGKMIMRPKEGGFVIPAGGSHQLTPGGDHIMLMDVAEKVEPGAEVPFTLTLQGGGTFSFTAVGKDFAGAKENYQPGMEGMNEGDGHE